LSDCVSLLEKEIVRLQKSEYRWRTKYKNLTQKEKGAANGSTLIESVHKAINVFMHSEDQYMEMSGRRSDKARHQYRYAVASSIWTNKSTFYEYLRPLLIDHVKKHLHETVFHPARILMRMDMAGGTLEVLRMCETDGKKYVRNTIISCSAEIKRCCLKVDNLTKLVVPYEHGYLDEANGGGEYIQWDPQHLLSGMIKAYQLTEVAKVRPVEIHVSIDGAMLSKNWNHLTAGVKQGDSAAFCPRRQQLIYGNTDNTMIQSRDHCFPFIIAMV